MIIIRPIITKIVFVILLFLFSSSHGYSQKLQYKGFSGGMMVNTGYVSSGDFSIVNPSGEIISSQRAAGTPFGIGGAIKIHLSNHFRVGSEGYVSTLKYDNYGSYASIGWGGALVDWVWQLKSIAPYFGVCIGGGSQKNLTLGESYGDDYISSDNTSFRKYSFMAVTPYAGFEVRLTDKVRLMFKADYLMNVSNPQTDCMRGVRVFVGFSFYRLKTDQK